MRGHMCYLKAREQTDLTRTNVSDYQLECIRLHAINQKQSNMHSELGAYSKTKMNIFTSFRIETLEIVNGPTFLGCGLFLLPESGLARALAISIF